MTIQQLEYILEVKRCGTIAQAAKNLYVTPACVGNAIRSLEEELGFAIFERSWHGVVPTPQGVKALEHARAICKHQQLLTQSAQEVRTVRIETGLNPLFADVFLHLVEEYRGRTDVILCHQQPQNASKSGGQSVEDRLLALETDVFVSFVPGMDSRVVLRKYTALKKRLSPQVRAAVPAVVYIGAGHPLYHKPDLQLSDFAQETFVDTPSASVANSGMLKRALGFTPAHMLLVAEGETRRKLIAEGHGFSFGPQFSDRLSQQYGFRTVPTPDTSSYLLSITNPIRPVSPEAQRYLELLDAQIASIRTDG